MNLPIVIRRAVALLVAGLITAWAPVSAPAAERTTPTAPPEYLALKNPVALTPDILKEAEALYNKHKCKKCHGANGKGRGSATKGMKIKPRDYTDQGVMEKLSDGHLYWIILNGSDKDTTEMEGFKGKVTEEQAWKLIHYIRAFARQPTGGGS